jgi:hypothetical protein
MIFTALSTPTIVFADGEVMHGVSDGIIAKARSKVAQGIYFPNN